MSSTSVNTRPRRHREGIRGASRTAPPVPRKPVHIEGRTRRRIASNFAFLSAAELICRTTSVIVTLSLPARLGLDGYGRIDFAFHVASWLVLMLRDSSDVIVSREVSRHPRLIRPLVDQVLAYKGLLSLVLFSALTTIGSWTMADPSDWIILTFYGLMLFTTAIGLDYVYRGTERMGLVAVSLCLRTGIYAFGVFFFVHDASRITWVPILLTIGEVSGIALVWGNYLINYRMPRPRLSLRFLAIILHRGRTVCLIQLSQAMINSADYLVIGLLNPWTEVGRYGVPYRMATALLTFGLILQQAAFPTLSRLWRQSACAGREALDSLVEVLMTGLVPIAVGGTILADSLIQTFSPEYESGVSILLALLVWRAPLLILAYLYQTTLIALNRETVGVRSLLAAAVCIGPLILLLHWLFGMPGAALAVLMVGFGLVLAGYSCLAREGRQPAWHHHLARPLVASVAMIPVCQFLQQRYHVLWAVLGGAVAYVLVWVALGGLKHTQLWRKQLGPMPEPSRTS